MSFDEFAWRPLATTGLKTVNPLTGRRWQRLLAVVISATLILSLLSGCAVPRVKAEDRLFLDLSLELVSGSILPKQSFEGEAVGGISAIAYDVPRDRLYALSDNRNQPRFYTLQIKDLATSPTLTVESVTYLKDNEGNLFPPGDLDPEGLAITPSNTLLISSEGSSRRRVAPAIGEYDLATGQLQRALPLPERYIPDSILNPEASTQAGEQTQGVQENLSFEALTINVSSGTGGVYEPYRLFVATEGPLLQDLDFAPEIPYKNRFLHYTLDPYQTEIISEHLYEMELAPTGAVLHGLSEMELLDQGGHFLGLERSYGFQGFDLKLYQLASGGATDISAIDFLQGDTSGISAIRKELVLDLADVAIAASSPQQDLLQNYEAMTMGPTLPGGGQSLLIMSDDNFDVEQETSLLVFRLKLS